MDSIASMTREELETRLEYAYRCIESGFVRGMFDFTVLRRDASNYLTELDALREKLMGKSLQDEVPLS